MLSAIAKAPDKEATAAKLSGLRKPNLTAP